MTAASELDAFRAEVRAWMEDAARDLPPRPDFTDLRARREYDSAWARRLLDAGYAGFSWPKEYGGRAASVTEELVFLEEAERAGVPDVGVHFAGQLFIGPTIIAVGTEEQKERYLAPILSGDEVWCQGFSEPNAGSDLAGLSTRAVRDGDYYVVNGQKVWTSFCEIADLCELLVRTDPDAPKHKGITALIVPMDTPGIEVRPIKTILGHSEFGEVFFDDVRVPVENRLGPENEGWRVAMTTLGFERGTAFARSLLELMKLVEDLKRLAQRIPEPGGGTVWDDPAVRREIGRMAVDFDALWAMLRANVAKVDRVGSVGLEGSLFKLAFSEAGQRLGNLTLRLLGPNLAAPTAVDAELAPRLVARAMQSINLTLAGGTSEIQRNIIAEAGLGLPKG